MGTLAPSTFLTNACLSSLSASIAMHITVEFDPVVYNVTEHSTNVVVMLTASSAAPSAYTVTVTTQDGTAVGK